MPSIPTAIALVAHTGHPGTAFGGLWDGLIHPITGLDHMLAMVAVGILAAVVADRRIAWATPAAFVAGMLAGGVLGIVGVGAGFVETTIAASVVVLGGLIAGTLAPSVRVGSWVPAVALAFGAIHGVAHGSEVPNNASPYLYVLGFVFMTLALHLSGALLGTKVGGRAGVRAALAGVVSSTGVAILVGLPI